MLILRLQPENSIEIMLYGVESSNNNLPFIVICKHESKFDVYLKNKFSANAQIRFIREIYDIEVINHLHYFSNIYFYEQTIGARKPSRLGVIGSNALIGANENEFISAILGPDFFILHQLKRSQI